MLCKIAQLYVDVPDTGNMRERCLSYVCENTASADIVIDKNKYNFDKYKGVPENSVIYMESCAQYCRALLHYNGLMLHASAIELNGKAYLFSGPCGTGKSTHSRLWLELFGENAAVINDDKPTLRSINGKWFAYGTPWCGKDGINLNRKASLAGICFLKQANQNKIRRLDKKEAVSKILWQTVRRFDSADKLDLLLENIESLVNSIPMYELENLPQTSAAQLSYATMFEGAKEYNL